MTTATTTAPANAPAKLLGVDGGGTTTEACLAEPGGRILGQGKSGPSNAKAVGLEAARAALDGAIRAAFHDAGLDPAPVEAACLGLAGFDRPDDRRILASWAKECAWAHQMVPANDGDLVIAAGTPEGWGVGVIAGTGSIAVGRAPDGRAARSGGWGHLIGDEGSAYAVVLDAFRLVVRCADGREPSRSGIDRLSDRLRAALGVTATPEIVTALYGPGFDRSRIASLASEVVAACDDSAEMSRLLLEPAGKSLAAMAIAVSMALGWPSGPIPLTAAGGFLLSATRVFDAMLDELARHGYQPSVVSVPRPVLGALVLAERALAEKGRLV